jgi:hypothetical protein
MDENRHAEIERLKHQTIRTIWGCATGMMGICIPLSAVTNSGPVLPILTVIGAVVGTAAMNRSGEKASKQSKQSSDLARLEAQHQQQIAELEERLSNVETIGRFSSYLEEKELAQTPLTQEPIARDTLTPSSPSRSSRPRARSTEVA